VTPLHRLALATRSTANRLIAGTAVGVVGMFLAAAPSAQAAAPAWTLHMGHEPAAFQRLDEGDQYIVTVENSGDETTTGTYVLDDTLPPELTVASVSAGGGWTCTTREEVIAGTPLSCSSSEPLEGGTSSVAVSVGFHVPATAAETVTNSATISGGGALTGASAADSVMVNDRPPYSVQGFSARAIDAGNGDYTIAGGHPYQGTTSFSFPTYRPPLVLGAFTPSEPYPVEELNEAYVELPPGFLGNPAAAPRCPLIKFTPIFPACPPGSRVGTFDFGAKGIVSHYAIYNVVPERGYPAEFAFKFSNFAITLYPTLRPRTGSYGVTIAAPGASRFGLTSIGVTLFGVPSTQNFVGGPEEPFLSNPVNCSQTHPITSVALDSWENPGRTLPDRSSGLKVPDLSDPNWKTATAPAPPVTECDSSALTSQWNPSFTAQPLSEHGGPLRANEPAGLKVDLDFPQKNDPTNPGEAFDPSIPQAPELKKATVALPSGVAISPSAADGLGGCSDLASDPEGDQVHYDDTMPVSCPTVSKIGTVTATSPLLAAHNPETDVITGPEPISGEVFLLKPHPGDLPTGNEQEGTYRLLIQLESERYGINVKLPGVVKADKHSGQLTATFTENPQLPVKHLELNLRSGPRAPLSTPKACGSYTSTADLEPWSAPGTPNAERSSSFHLDQSCPQSLGQRPFNPALSAGTEGSGAGASSPFVMHLTRGDNEQEFSSLDATLPKGLTAKLAGVPYCSDAAIAAATGKSGAAEQANASCPASSQIGSLTTGAGPGPNPYYVTGKAYLAGPYKGAPISLAFITPAVAGPFDLGNVVIRAAAFVDPETAQVTVKTDQLPQILDGVPLGIRSIAVKVDRPGFTQNPTDCDAKWINLNVSGASGANANPADGFQVGSCDKLGFGPKLKIQLKGATKRIGHPALSAVVTAGPGEANIGSAQVNLPHGEFLDQGNLNKTCTKPVLMAGKCPASSVYGTARAWTPLLDQPLEGPVYLVGGYGYKLPALVAELNGQIKVLLVGKVDSGPNKGIRNTFELVPDAPVSRFELEMKGGKKYGLLENSENLCKASKANRRANVRFTGQNGKVEQFKPVVANQCGKKKSK
jgi:uncharacterized repeat protein (TIGR01451 family)